VSELSPLDWARSIASTLTEEVAEATLPPQEGLTSPGQRVINRALVARTKNYIEKVIEQINGTYECGCFDACSVMLRRAVETLIIECFEAKGIASKIKGTDGNFFQLADLVDRAIQESDSHGAWNLSRNTKDGLKKIKKKGDLSAHNRRYLAHRSDIDDIRDDFRVVVQELISISGIQRAK
jgi:hypothetical protein